MAQCTICGYEMDEGYQYCPKCGRGLDHASSSTSAMQRPLKAGPAVAVGLAIVAVGLVLFFVHKFYQDTPCGAVRSFVCAFADGSAERMAYYTLDPQPDAVPAIEEGLKTIGDARRFCPRITSLKKLEAPPEDSLKGTIGDFGDMHTYVYTSPKSAAIVEVVFRFSWGSTMKTRVLVIRNSAGWRLEGGDAEDLMVALAQACYKESDWAESSGDADGSSAGRRVRQERRGAVSIVRIREGIMKNLGTAKAEDVSDNELAVLCFCEAYLRGDHAAMDAIAYAGCKHSDIVSMGFPRRIVAYANRTHEVTSQYRVGVNADDGREWYLIFSVDTGRIVSVDKDEELTSEPSERLREPLKPLTAKDRLGIIGSINGNSGAGDSYVQFHNRGKYKSYTCVGRIDEWCGSNLLMKYERGRWKEVFSSNGDHLRSELEKAGIPDDIIGVFFYSLPVMGVDGGEETGWALRVD